MTLIKIKEKLYSLPLNNRQIKLIGWIFITLAVFLLGYYLRAYFPLSRPLPFSPYDAFYEANLFNDQLHQSLDLFSAKAIKYPVGYYLSLWQRMFFPHLYLTYIIGGILLFFLGKEISGKNLGGILAFFAYAVASENLIRYSGVAYPASFSYIFILAALLFLLKYLKANNNYHFLFFCLSSVLAVTSYHTGATAFLSIDFGLLISTVFSPKNIDKKLLMAFFLLVVFYLLVVFSADPKQLSLIGSALNKINWLFYLPIMAWLTLGVWLLIKGLGSIKWIQSEYLPLIILVPTAILIFFNIGIFSPFLKLGVANYYSSTITLNNYLAQALVLHIYLILMLASLYQSRDDENVIFIRGWIIGLVIISTGLILENYFARVLDYTFPLMFILFGWYWSKNKKFRKTVVTATLLLLAASQLIIFNDPFSMRRYYNRNEIDAAKKVISLNLDGVMISDLRTAALFNYLGDKNVKFPPNSSPQYNLLFYQFRKLKPYFIANKLESAKFPPRYLKSDYYLILSESMKTILYSTNFQTKPLTGKIFNYYDANFTKVYDDGLMRVYQLYKKY